VNLEDGVMQAKFVGQFEPLLPPIHLALPCERDSLHGMRRFIGNVPLLRFEGLLFMR